MPTKKQIKVWRERGSPICSSCRQPVYGNENFQNFKKTGMCYGCNSDFTRMRDYSWLSVPPKGISHEE